MITNFCSRPWRFLVLLISIIAFSQTPAQDPKSLPSEDVIKINTELVVIDAQVLEKKTNKIIGDLKATDFELYDNGVKQEITNFSQDKLPLSVLLLLDVSGSMKGVIKKLQEGALQALQRLKPEDEVALAAFGTKMVVIQDFTKERSLITEKITGIYETGRELGAGRGTRINAAIHQGAQHMGTLSNTTNRRVMIVITDNFSQMMRGAARKTYEELFESGSTVCGLIVRDKGGKALATVNKVSKIAQIIGVATGNPVSIAQMAIQADATVDPFAQKTGGEVLTAEMDLVSEKLATLFDHLRTRYSLGYSPTDTAEKRKFRKLKLKLNPETEKRLGDVLVRTKQGYYTLKKNRPVAEEKKPRTFAPQS